MRVVSLSFMEEQALGWLFCHTVGVRPSLRSCRSILRRPSTCGQSMALKDAAVCYGMTGGIPIYRRRVDPVAPLKDNIKRLFLTPLRAISLRSRVTCYCKSAAIPMQYDAIVQAIAQGRSKISRLFLRNPCEQRKELWIAGVAD